MKILIFMIGMTKITEQVAVIMVRGIHTDSNKTMIISSTNQTMISEMISMIIIQIAASKDFLRALTIPILGTKDGSENPAVEAKTEIHKTKETEEIGAIRTKKVGETKTKEIGGIKTKITGETRTIGKAKTEAVKIGETTKVMATKGTTNKVMKIMAHKEMRTKVGEMTPIGITKTKAGVTKTKVGEMNFQVITATNAVSRVEETNKDLVEDAPVMVEETVTKRLAIGNLRFPIVFI